MAWPFALALHKNPGIIFDISVPLAIIIPTTVVLCVAMMMLAYRNVRTAYEKSLALWWIVCGATGNVVDRIMNNFTTDYLIFFRRSAINLSDILIVTGALLYLYYSRDILPEDTKH